MNASAPESRAARRTASCDASGSANAMFSRTVSVNRNVSSKTIPIDFRRSRTVMSRTSTPSSNTRPASTS